MPVNLLNPGCGGDDCYPCGGCPTPVVICDFAAGVSGATFHYEITDATSATITITCYGIATSTAISLTSGAATGSVPLEEGCTSYCIAATNPCGTTNCCKTQVCQNISDFNGYLFLCGSLHCCPADDFVAVAIDLGSLPDDGTTIISLSDYSCPMTFGRYASGVLTEWPVTVSFTNVRMSIYTESGSKMRITFLATWSWTADMAYSIPNYDFIIATLDTVCDAFGPTRGDWYSQNYKVTNISGDWHGFDASANGCGGITLGDAYVAKLENLPACP